MPTPADQRLLELLDKWLSSLDLHLKYSSLDEDTYWKVQPWVEHQRPSRWIIDLAKQKTLALRAEVGRRVEAGDAGFSDALELMTFLANLVGSQHIERFIPLADPDSEQQVTASVRKAAAGAEETREMPAPRPSPAKASEPLTATQEMLRFDRPGTAATATREMPRFTPRPPADPAPVATSQVARVERRAAPAGDEDTVVSPAPASRASAGARATASARAAAGESADIEGHKASSRAGIRNRADSPPPVSADMCEQIIADAARLMQWGRKWYELAELISRMADRPPLPDVRRVLKDQKAHIERLAGR